MSKRIILKSANLEKVTCQSVKEIDKDRKIMHIVDFVRNFEDMGTLCFTTVTIIKDKQSFLHSSMHCLEEVARNYFADLRKSGYILTQKSI